MLCFRNFYSVEQSEFMQYSEVMYLTVLLCIYYRQSVVQSLKNKNVFEVITHFLLLVLICRIGVINIEKNSNFLLLDRES